MTDPITILGGRDAARDWIGGIAARTYHPWDNTKRLEAVCDLALRALDQPAPAQDAESLRALREIVELHKREREGGTDEAVSFAEWRRRSDALHDAIDAAEKLTAAAGGEAAKPKAHTVARGDAIAAIGTALGTLHRVCEEQRGQLRMCVPARPDACDDLVISTGLETASAYITTVETERDQALAAAEQARGRVGDLELACEMHVDSLRTRIAEAREERRAKEKAEAAAEQARKDAATDFERRKQAEKHAEECRVALVKANDATIKAEAERDALKAQVAEAGRARAIEELGNIEAVTDCLRDPPPVVVAAIRARLAALRAEQPEATRGEAKPEVASAPSAEAVFAAARSVQHAWDNTREKLSPHLHGAMVELRTVLTMGSAPAATAASAPEPAGEDKAWRANLDAALSQAEHTITGDASGDASRQDQDLLAVVRLLVKARRALPGEGGGR